MYKQLVLAVCIVSLTAVWAAGAPYGPMSIEETLPPVGLDDAASSPRGVLLPPLSQEPIPLPQRTQQPRPMPLPVRTISQAAMAVAPPAVEVKPIPPVPDDELPMPKVTPSPAAPSPSVPSAPAAILPPPLPVPQSVEIPQRPPHPDLNALMRDLEKLRQARNKMEIGRTLVVPSDAARPASPDKITGNETSLQLQMRLAKMMEKLKELRARAQEASPPAQGHAVPTAPVTKDSLHQGHPEVTPPQHPPETPGEKEPLVEGPVDAAELGRIQFLSGNYPGALSAYREIDLTSQLPEDQLMTKYMIACCLRKIGNLEEAASLYREVGNSGGSEVLVKNAQWHLQTMKARQELFADLEKIRARREMLTRRPG